jgi:hypothetical protein
MRARLDLRRPVWAVHVLVVGLAFHNLVVSQLWHAGLRGGALTVVSAWKDALLVAALALVLWARRREPLRLHPVDWLALAFGVFVVAYGVVPQSVLDGDATTKGVLYGLRHDLLPVGGYFLGRLLALSQQERRSVGRTIVVTGIAVAALGLADVFLVHLQWWRTNGTIGWFRDQLGIDTRTSGLSGLPENFVYNAGGGDVFRRLVSTFLSPLATAYLLVVALIALVASQRARFARWAPPVGALLFAGLLWTHTRAAIFALAGALVVLACTSRRVAPLLAAVLVAAVGVLFLHEYRHVGPRTHFTHRELVRQNEIAAQSKGSGVSSTGEHASALREGLRKVVHHPQGFGVGNAGVSAQRTGVLPAAGESTYTEIGVETGLAGGLVFLAWSLLLLGRSVWRCPWVGAALAAVLAIGIQTDVIGIPWIAVVVWALAGSSV